MENLSFGMRFVKRMPVHDMLWRRMSRGRLFPIGGTLAQCRYMILCLSCLFSLSFLTSAHAEQALRVQVSEYPPYYTKGEDGQYRGIGIEFIRLMSEMSPNYSFEYLETSVRRRHMLFFDNNIDISLFDRKEWGWAGKPIDSTAPYYRGGEKYIAPIRQVTGSDYFKSVQDKSIAGILGFHYGFANFVSDPSKLRDNFKIDLLQSQEQIVKMVRNERVQIGIVSEAFIKSYINQDKVLSRQIVISDNYDQEYGLVAIRNMASKISLEELNQLVRDVYNSERFMSVLRDYGLN